MEHQGEGPGSLHDHMELSQLRDLDRLPLSIPQNSTLLHSLYWGAGDWVLWASPFLSIVLHILSLCCALGAC